MSEKAFLLELRKSDILLTCIFMYLAQVIQFCAEKQRITVFLLEKLYAVFLTLSEMWQTLISADSSVQFDALYCLLV